MPGSQSGWRRKGLEAGPSVQEGPGNRGQMLATLKGQGLDLNFSLPQVNVSIPRGLPFRSPEIQRDELVSVAWGRGTGLSEVGDRVWDRVCLQHH